MNKYNFSYILLKINKSQLNVSHQILDHLISIISVYYFKIKIKIKKSKSIFEVLQFLIFIHFKIIININYFENVIKI